jgi:hypothetical protein
MTVIRGLDHLIAGFDEKWIGCVEPILQGKTVTRRRPAQRIRLRSREVVDTPAGPQVRLQFLAR